MSYSNSFPTQRPSLNLDFANSGKLDSRLSYSRSSTGTAFSAERHKSSENLIPYSNDLSSWSTDNKTTTPTTNNAAPDGTNTSTAVIESADGGTHYIYTNFSSVSGVSYTFVTYAKANGRTKFTLSAGATSAVAVVTFDLTAGTSTVSSGSADSHSIAAIGSTGWHKCVVTVTATGTGSTAYHSINLLDASGASSYTGDGSSGLFLWGMQVSTTGQTTLSQTSGQIHREFAPTLKTAAADAPRFEYSATDGQPDGLLIEQQFTQYALYSEAFDNGWWAKVNATVQPNSAVAPDGTLSADLLVENYETGGTNSHYAQQNTLSSVSVGATYTWTIFAKAAGRSAIAIYSSIGGANVIGYWNLTDGSVTSTSGTGSFSSTNCGNGWYRLKMTFTTVNTSGGGTYLYTVNGGATGYQGNGYGSVLLWGANLTKTASSMSYLKAEGSQTTKSADSCSVDLSQTSYSGPVSIVAETPAGAGEGFIPYLFSLTGGDQNFYAFKNTTSATATDDWRYQVGGSGTTVSGSAGSDKVAIRWTSGDVKAQFSTGVSSTNSDAVATAFTNLKIGSNPANLYQLNGNFKRLSLYSVALSDTELAALVD